MRLMSTVATSTRLATRQDRSLGGLLTHAADLLKATSETPRLDAELLLAFVSGFPRSTVIAFPERCVSAHSQTKYDECVRRRSDGEPLAYITGTKEFYSHCLTVTPAVLVPRPETEILVEALLSRVDTASNVAILDLGTGSGALGLAIKQCRPRAAVSAVDSSPAALDVARANAARLGLDIEFIESNWFDDVGARRFDFIVCNPPYVRSADPHFGGPLRHEPRQALDGGADGLDAIRAILGTAAGFLNPHGSLLLEHGYDQHESVLSLATASGFDVLGSRTDLAGYQRVAVLQGR